jgi:hypothetical protein
VYYFLTKLILKILNTIKGHIQSNLKVPHPIFVALGISIATTVIVVSIFYIADIGIMRIEDAEAITKFKPKDDGD